MSILSLATLLFSWLFIAVITALVCAPAYPLVRRISAKVPVHAKPRILFGYAFLPVVCATLSIVIYELPVLNALLVDYHCHNEQCGPHSLYAPVSGSIGAGVLIVGVLLLVALILVLLRQIRNNVRFNITLSAVGKAEMHSSYRIIETHEPGAWCVGLFDPIIYLTRGLLHQFTPEQVAMVVHHEVCHAKHLDNLKLLLARWITLIWLPWQRKQLLSDLANAHELRCDAYALSQSGCHSASEALVQACMQHAAPPSQQGRINAIRHSEHGGTAKVAKLYAVFACLVVLCAAAMLIIVVVHLGHPVIEWLMQ